MLHSVDSRQSGQNKAMRTLSLLFVCATVGTTVGWAQTPAGTAPQAQATFRAETTLVEVSAVVTQTPSSRVGTPCGVGSHAANSSSCADPTRAVRRLETLRNVADLLATAGSRRKVLFWVTEDMGATVVDPTEGRRAQVEAFRTVLSADVAVYPVHPDELPSAPEPDPGGVVMLGGNAVSITTDELAGVTLDQMARESGGRWIVNINDHEVVVAQVVKQNSTASLLVYESMRAREPGRHRIDVRVRRPGVRVYARRGFVVPDAPASTAPDQERADLRAMLGELPSPASTAQVPRSAISRGRPLTNR